MIEIINGTEDQYTAMLTLANIGLVDEDLISASRTTAAALPLPPGRLIWWSNGTGRLESGCRRSDSIGT